MKSIQKNPYPEKVFASPERIVALRASIDAASLTVKAAAALSGVSVSKFEQKLRGYSPVRSEEIEEWIKVISEKQK